MGRSLFAKLHRRFGRRIGGDERGQRAGASSKRNASSLFSAKKTATSSFHARSAELAGVAQDDEGIVPGSLAEVAARVKLFVSFVSLW